MGIAKIELEYNVTITSYDPTACAMTIIIATTPNQNKELQKLYPGKFKEGIQFPRVLTENLPQDKELYEILKFLLHEDDNKAFYGKELKVPETLLTIKGSPIQILHWEKKEYKIIT